MKTRKFRILTSATLICMGVFLLSSPSSWARRKGSIHDYCNQKATNASDKCIAAGMSPTYCADIANRTYSNCIRRLTGAPDGTTVGNIGDKYPSPTPPPNVRHPTPVGDASPPPIPVKMKPIHPISGPVTNKSPAPSPSPTAQTIYAKPKSTPSPRPEHHGGHQG